ncbi:MAG: hypothetical protein POELPBGB_03245 [Bacteroidia bacterium]|nr:hypothetical protein [Bacteroidia bacterium]
MKKLLLILSSAFFILNCFAQPGEIDLTFNSGDTGFGNGDGFSSPVHALLYLPNGKTLVGGKFGSFNSEVKRGLTCLNSDGTIDNTFNVEAGFVYSLVLQPDGKILAAGMFTSFNGEDRNCIVRLNSDGSLDNTFNTGVGFDINYENEVFAIALQPDGKIVLAGDFFSFNGVERNYILRLNADGSLDNSFDAGSTFNDMIYALAVQPDGKIIAGGEFTSKRIQRLNSNGSLDNTFVSGTAFNNLFNRVQALLLQDDGKLLVGGSFGSYNGTTSRAIVRINTNGSIDETFTSGFSGSSAVYCLMFQPDGKIIAAGTFATYSSTTRNDIVRINTDGSLDATFNSNGGYDNIIRCIALQADGKIITGGDFQETDNVGSSYLSRLNSDGSRDISYTHPGTGFNGEIRAMKLQPDGKIIAGGTFSWVNGISNNHIVRLNNDGSVDNTFSIGTGAQIIGSNTGVGYYSAIAVQTDGKIIVGGDFTSFNGTAINRIVRLNSDGSIDGSFNPGTGFNDFVNSIALQPDGKIIIVGNFTTFNGTTAKRIVRLNSDGSQDATFIVGTGFPSDVRHVVIQSDNKIIATGMFTTYNGSSSYRIVRLNSDGSIDSNFNIGTGFSATVSECLLQPDGKILCVGGFSSFNGTNRNYIARINSDGSLDNSFDPGLGFSPSTSSVALQSDGKIIVGGNFAAFNNDSTIKCITRLNSDGSHDNSFITGTSFRKGAYSLPILYAIVIQQDGNIVTAGNFTSYNGIGRNRIARLIADPPCSGYFTLYPDVQPLHYIAENHATGSGTLSYSWDWGDGTFDNIAYPSHTYDIAGDYTICLTVTDANNCTHTYCNDYTFKTESPIAYINVIDPLTVGIAQSEKEKGDLIIYPNPATNTLTIETETAKGIYQLQDITGKVLLSGSLTATKFTLDISALSKGIYLLSLIEDEQQVNRKIVKE